jgi:D-glycero-D-manno-heptose 1,7-bisphosphate phosphatase
MTLRHIILDRDGVLNQEAEGGGYITRPEDFIWVPGALEALRLLRQAGLYLSVATNQSGVGRGIMSLAQLEAVHERMRVGAAEHGVAFDAVFFCPHGPQDGCDCRKPAPGMIHAAIARAAIVRPEIAADETILVGDADRDLEAATRAGIRAALVRTGKGRKTEAELKGVHVPTYDDLPEFARALLRG